MAEESWNFVDPDGGKTRFLLELEFVQLLANPEYIHYLAQNRTLEDPAFINYLSYLQYWRKPEYAKFIVNNRLQTLNEQVAKEKSEKGSTSSSSVNETTSFSGSDNKSVRREASEENGFHVIMDEFDDGGETL